MKKLLAILLLASGLQTSIAQKNYEQMTSFLEELNAQGRFMGSVAIADANGKIVYARSVGYLDENKTLANAESIYRIGSISKTFTTVMIFQLIEKKKLKLTTPLSKFFKKIPNSKKITIDHLLHHASGLPNMTDREDYLTYYTSEQSKEQILERFYSYTPEFEPGSNNQYSNTNFILLGFILEKVTGKSYADALQEMICKPLKLAHTAYGDQIETEKNEAHSFVRKENDWVQEAETHMSVPHGAGAVTSTVKDLCTFMDAIYKCKIVSAASLSKMKELSRMHGRGLFPAPFHEHLSWGHSGAIDGFLSNASFFEKDSMTFAILSNACNYSMNEIQIGILSYYFGKDFEIPNLKTVKVDGKILKKYEGTFSKEGFPLKLTISTEGDQLKAQATGQDAFALEAESENVFHQFQYGIRITFNADGTELTIRQGGQDILMKKE